MAAKTNTKKLSSEFIRKLTEISAGYIPAEKLEEILQFFEIEINNHYFDFNSESNLLRIILGMYDKITFLNNCIKYPHYIEIIVSVAVNSNYLTDVLVRNPEFFYWIVNPSILNTSIEKNKFPLSLSNSLTAYKSFGSKVKMLRINKRKELLRIGLRDILNITDLKNITEELSTLAGSITSELFNLCYSEILKKYELQNLENTYCLLALGKLGGNELNYSSDIDLIIFYDKNSQINKQKNYQEILTEAVYLFIESATAITGAGYIYRVDFRLRPDGRNSQLCRSLLEYLNYYESRGEDWERQMLIKTDFINGNFELYKKFKNYLTPFIYPSSFSYSPTEQIKKLKRNIEKNIGEEENIKLISGGIRDIEFSVQALQLLNGGKNLQLQTQNTLNAISQLQILNLLSADEAKIFSESYIFYRRIEHFLQLMNDSQTHTIPAEGETLEKLVSFLNFKNATLFKSEVSKKRKEVKKIYNSIMGIETSAVKRASVERINFENKKRAGKDLEFLREGKGLLGQKQFDKKSILAFFEIENILFEYLKTADNPDLVLQNFVRIIRTVTFPSIWYQQFLDKNFFISFLNVCQYSQRSIDLFAEDEDLLEYFLTGKVFEKINNSSLSIFSTKKFLFILSVQFCLKIISAVQVSKYLSAFVKQKIATIQKNELEFVLKDDEYMIAALGSLGAGEMTFASDIDLIFISSLPASTENLQIKFQALLQKIKAELKPFNTDCRLRPEGKSSLLVWELNSYKKYISERARIWELQAFCKLNFISGNKQIFSSLSTSIKRRMVKEKDEDLKREILDMRKRLYPKDISLIANFFHLKRSKGGIMDIEFILQYIILNNPRYYSICRGKGILKTISLIKKTSVYFNDLEELKSNYTFLKTIALTNQNLFNSTRSVLPSDKNKLRILAKNAYKISENDFNKKIILITKYNFRTFQKYLGS